MCQSLPYDPTGAGAGTAAPLQAASSEVKGW
jgi:hypothetical protein